MTENFITIAEAARKIAKKEISPVELTKDCLARISALDGTLHAFITVTEERALADAKSAETRMMAGTLKGPLDGIPIGLKDIIDTNGILTTCHSAQLTDNVPDTDATCAVKLAEAGTVLMGKLSTHEFADGGPSFDLPWPPARNPWNPDHFTAGSSSGTGAAVPAGMILGGLGTDTGGSIRGPAALCGIAGIKATYGRVSRAGVSPAAFSLDHIGPMAWTSEDCAIMLNALAGHDARDPASAKVPVPDYTADLPLGAKGLRIGVIHHFHEIDNKVSEATQRGIDETIATLKGLGATAREIKLSPLQDWAACGSIISMTERPAAYETMIKENLGKFGERLRNRLLVSMFISGVDYVQAVRRRRELCAELAAACADIDILITAAQPNEAPLIDKVPSWDNMERPNFTMPFNVSGYPAISICSGFGEGGLPVAVQLIAKPFAEATLFRAAHAYEQATPWRQKRPSLDFSAATLKHAAN
jgi:aspartyl-tRNA(Asn)/glutamyl-tRNA(Gln) amidotransferase subunit A